MVFRFFRRSPAWPKLAKRKLLSIEAFAAVVEHERLRTERTEGKFCLLEISSAKRSHGPLVAVAERIEQAIRRTDVAGEFNDGLGILLPDTGPDGASIVQEKLTSELDVDCKLYVYPTDDRPEEDEQQEHDTESRGGGAGRLEDSRGVAVAGASSSHFAAADVNVNSLEGEMVLEGGYFKRIVDIVGAGMGLIVLSPIILLAMAAVKLTSKGPVFFAQRRAGQGGRPFTMYKLRTMVADAESRQCELRSESEQDGPAFKMENDPRITLVGRFLRKSCIDELPQLWNVLVGQMSLVGPRPLPVKESALIPSWARARLRVKPGLTCIWQVEGGRHVKFDDWMRMDIQYILGQNASRDLGLVVRTAVNVLLHRAST